MVENDVDDVMKKYGDQITIMGGLNNRIIDSPEATEEDIRAEVRRGMDAHCGQGRYIPYYIPAVEKNWLIYMDEVNRYGADIFKK